MTYLTRWWLILRLAGITPVTTGAQEASANKPASAASDYSKEAYVIEQLYTRVRHENDSTGTRLQIFETPGRNEKPRP